MIDPVDELKTRARLLQRRVESGEPQALERMRVLPELREVSRAEDVQHKHYLAVISRELGFQGYEHARRVLRAEPGERDLGTLMHTYGGFLNSWFTSHEEARAAREANGGYLVPYKRQMIVVERGYVEALGLSPDDPDWRAIGFDLLDPADPEARSRLYAKRLRALPPEGAPAR